MTPDDLIERVARAMALVRWSDADLWGLLKDEARIAIAIVLEDAAKELEGWDDVYGYHAATAIRALIPSGKSEGE